MKIWAITGVAALIGGCASTPTDLLETGERFTSDHKASPQKTAECIASHVKATNQNMLARIEPSPTLPSAVRIIVGTLGEKPTTMAVIDATPDGAGSMLTWYLHHKDWLLGNADAFMGKIRGAC